jgi:hypothetical protein
MSTLTELAKALFDALERETAALRHGDYAAAARLAGPKLIALKAFTEAAAEPGASIAPPPPPPAVEPQAEEEPTSQPDIPDPRYVLERLRLAATENRIALEAALAVQGRIVEVVTDALRAQAGSPLGYGNNVPAQPVPFVLSVKA